MTASSAHDPLDAGAAGVTAISLLSLATSAARPATLFHVARDPATADELFALLRVLDPALGLVLLPPLDSLPYDRIAPTRAAMGARMAALAALMDAGTKGMLVLTSTAALIRRVPPRHVWRDLRIDIRVGDPIDGDGLQGALERNGYLLDDRVDEPGEYARHGKVIDIFPAGQEFPVRVEHEDGVVSGIKIYDPATQRSHEQVPHIAILPASELVPVESADPRVAHDRLLVQRHGALETLFDYAPDAALLVEDGRAFARAFRRVTEAHAYETENTRSGSLPAPDRLYLTPEEWRHHAARRIAAASVTPDESRPTPSFHARPSPVQALKTFVQERIAGGARVVLAGPAAGLARLVRRVERAAKVEITAAASWKEVAEAPPGTMLSLPLPLRNGFTLGDDIDVIAAADVFGETAAAGGKRGGKAFSTSGELRRGDTVVHIARGFAVLDGLETVETAPGVSSDVVRLTYRGGETLLVPVEEIGAIWRYGSDSDAVKPDRLAGGDWEERKAAAEAEIRSTAHQLAAAADRRRSAQAPKLTPSAAEYDAFVAEFPYTLTSDQASAVTAVLEDLASGQPMMRLVCGDVGYGKTEVALRAAAAAVLSGKQVAIAAPTTVLARQHATTFARRFAGIGIRVEQLSRLSTAADARAVRKGLADGSVKLVVGTHAIAAKGVSFHDLGLLIIDEEQRFGAAQKERLRSHAATAHMLVMSATPIPRTLQAGLAGLVDLSLIETPPTTRQPVRTIVHEFEPDLVRGALMREARRGGQSFVVCPRIEDIEPMRERLARLVPELSLKVAHGKLPAHELDQMMVDFAEGHGDVLLATNIIESGLDIPRANTMIVSRPDRFGLAQLHQLRGRVGRGNRRATAFLMTEPGQSLTPATEKRLRTLEANDRLGSGFAISERDLDARGAGDLFGVEQAGHVRLIGADLYRHLLAQALAAQRGEAAETPVPQVSLGGAGRIPEDYVADPDIRLNLYRQLMLARDERDVASFQDEIIDRFGSMPETASALIDIASLRIACKALGIARLDGGPQGMAVTFIDPEQPTIDLPEEVEFKDGRLIMARATASLQERLALARTLMESLTDRLGASC